MRSTTEPQVESMSKAMDLYPLQTLCKKIEQ